jgi:phospholipase/lecithinase/hemolysin
MNTYRKILISYRKILIFVILLTMLASGCSKQASPPPTPTIPPATSTTPPPTPTTPPITQIVAFGDDWADNGNSFRITKKDVENKVTDAGILPPSDLYWEGRFSNGPMPVEVMAQRLQAKLTSYAVNGALSGSGAGDGWGTITKGERPDSGLLYTGLLDQVTQFEKELNGKKADPEALYFVFNSTGNDFFWGVDLFNFSFPGLASIPDLANYFLNNVQNAITQLSELGAKRFFVVNTVDQMTMPYYVANPNKDLSSFQTLYQSQLPIKMADLAKKLNIEITVFDYQAISDRIRSDLQKYGLKNLTDPCLADYWATTACKNPDEYFYYDPFHPTRVVLRVIGEAMAAAYGK